jgi:branched-chain amino acid transport system substrate-binding protein
VKIVLALVLSLAAVVSAAAQGVVKLPIVAEITGGGASVGAMWRDAVNLAVEDINKKGGILGMRLETSVQDTQTDPPTSVAVMRRVLNDKPFAIFGR